MLQMWQIGIRFKTTLFRYIYYFLLLAHRFLNLFGESRHRPTISFVLSFYTKSKQQRHCNHQLYLDNKYSTIKTVLQFQVHIACDINVNGTQPLVWTVQSRWRENQPSSRFPTCNTSLKHKLASTCKGAVGQVRVGGNGQWNWIKRVLLCVSQQLHHKF